MGVEEERAAALRISSAYGRTLEMVPYFKYLGKVLLAADDDCPALIWNLTKEREVWRRMTRILSREGGRPRVSVFFLKDFIQSVLLFSAETWVVTPHMLQILGGLQD